MDRDPKTGRLLPGHQLSRKPIICPHCGKSVNVRAYVKLLKTAPKEMENDPFFCNGCESWKKRTQNYPRVVDGKQLCRECY